MGPQKEGFLKIHVGVDVSTKQILAIKITDEHSHDSKSLGYIVRESARCATITKLLGDGAFDSRKIFLHLDDRNIMMFGEEVRSRKRRNMIQELMLKVSLYDKFMAV
jgi:hypothetical protein